VPVPLVGGDGGGTTGVFVGVDVAGGGMRGVLVAVEVGVGGRVAVGGVVGV